MTWEDDSTLEWYVYLSNDIFTNGYVSKAVGGYAVGPMPQDEQLEVILPKEAYNLGKTAVRGSSRSRGHLVETRHPGDTQTGQSG